MPRTHRIHRGILFATALCAASASGYEQSGGRLSHQWITRQGWLMFQDQFGASEIDNFIGAVQEYPGGANNRVIEGVFDEDVANENPFNHDQPFNRHFWNFQANTYAKTFDSGLNLTGFPFDSAPNRAVKYVSGGNGVTGVYDNSWTNAQGAVQNQGIVHRYQNNDKNRAFYWLGNVAHLLQDISLPCHTLGDAHPVVADQDPLHDWVDGRAFSIAGNAAFNEPTSNRWELWTFFPGAHGIGRFGVPQQLDASKLRNAETIRNIVWQDQGLQASIPNNPAAQTLPLYNLFVETAGLADDFDSRDQRGQVDNGARNNNNGLYNSWTRAELNQVADTVVPRAGRVTAELFRYFYSLIDPTPAAVNIMGLSNDQQNPTVANNSFIQAQAIEDISGHDLDGFVFTAEIFDGQNWNAFRTITDSTSTANFFPLTDGLFRFKASVENGAGLIGTSGFSYMQVVPEPSMLGVILVGALGAIRRRR